ncbi:MAG: ParB/RepB/Spo0J family partition protein [Alphaproteobacteria bacterium]|nr:ParB/RepB/Spo0J family partition protein [Alphaproteobacteria bacterium]
MSAANKHGLGRGLGALLGDEDLNLDLDFLDEEKSGIKNVKLSQLHAGKFQPRTNFDDDKINQLAQSIKEKGVLQPLLVRKDFQGYEIIAGERRYRAAIIAGLEEVPVIEKELSDVETLEIGLIENIVRQDLDDLEEAAAFSKLMKDFSYTQEKISEIVCKSRSYIANSLRLLTLPDEIKELLSSKKISAGHARCLIGCENPIEVANKIIQE